MPEYVDLTDEQWEVLEPVIPKPARHRGRPWRGRREVLNGILYILYTGSTWAHLPPCYPPYQTCHRRFRQWVRSGVMRKILRALSENLPTPAERGAPQSPPDWTLAPSMSHAISLDALVPHSMHRSRNK